MEDEELMWGDPQWLEEEEEEGEEEQGDGKIIAAGLTAKDIAACCKVLDALARDPEAFSRREIKPVRVSLQPHVHAMMSKQYSGSGPEGRAIERAKQAAANSFRQKQAAHDRNAIRATALREGRSRRLDELTAGLPEDHPHHLLVPDGVPLEDAATPAKICDGCTEVGGDGEAEADGEGNEEAEGGRTREQKETFRLQSCYVCKCRFSQLHHFYDRLCPACAEVKSLIPPFPHFPNASPPEVPKLLIALHWQPKIEREVKTIRSRSFPKEWDDSKQRPAWTTGR